MPPKKSAPAPSFAPLRQLWAAANAPLLDLPDVPGLTLTRANTAGRAPAWRRPSQRSVVTPTSLSGSIAQALQGSSRPTPVRPSPSQAVLGLAGGAAETLSSPLNLASLAGGGAGTLARGAGLPALGRLLGRTALAADIAQTAPAVASGTQMIQEGVRTNRPDLVAGGVALSGLGAKGLRDTTQRAARILGAERAFARTPVGELGEGFTPEGFAPRVVPEGHPFRTGRTPYALLTSEHPKDMGPEVLPIAALQQQLRREGYSPVPVRGDYGGEEASLLIPGMPAEEAVALGRDLRQNAVITARGMERMDNPVIDVPTDVENLAGAREYFSEFVDPATGRLEKMSFSFDNPDFDMARGTRALAPMRRELEAAGPLVRLQHRTAVPVLRGQVLEPQALGMRTAAEQALGTPGVERARQMRYPDVFPPRAYATVAGGQVENLLTGKPSLFEGITPMRGIYDLAEDPLNLRAKAEAEALAYAELLAKVPTPELTETLLEKLIADRGFAGATYGKWRSRLPQGWEFGSPLPAEATQPRGDQLMLFKPLRMTRER